MLMSLLKSINKSKKIAHLKPKTTIIKIVPNGYGNSQNPLSISQRKEKVNKYLSELNKEDFIDRVKKSKIDITKSTELFSHKKTKEPSVDLSMPVSFRDGPMIFTTESADIQIEQDKKYSSSLNNGININKSINLENVEIEIDKSSKNLLKSKKPKKGKYNHRYSSMSSSLNESATSSPTKPKGEDTHNVNTITFVDIANDDEDGDHVNIIEEKDEFISEIKTLLKSIKDDYSNYDTIKASIITLVGKDYLNQQKFADVIFNESLNDNRNIKVYARLCKDVDKNIVNKKEKTKSELRVQLIDKCKRYFRNENSTIDNDIYTKAINNVDLIAELISAQMISKKVGVQCINYLFDQYSKIDQNDKEKEQQRKLILDKLLTLLDKFGTCVLYYQRSRIRSNELSQFEDDINNDISKLNALINSPDTVPSELYDKILQVIDKAKCGWAPSNEEAELYESVNQINTQGSVNSLNSNSLTESVNSNVILTTSSFGGSIQHSTTIESISDNTIVNGIYNDMNRFKKHISSNKKNTEHNYSWKYIDKLIMKDKIPFAEIIVAYIEAATSYLNNNNDKHFSDTYFRVILEYYNQYFSQDDCDAIVSTVTEQLKNLYNDSIENYYLNDIWTCVMFYLMDNRIFFTKNFNAFRGDSKENIKCIIGLMLDIAMYSQEKKKVILKEVKNSYLVRDNKDIMDSLYHI